MNSSRLFKGILAAGWEWFGGAKRRLLQCPGATTRGDW